MQKCVIDSIVLFLSHELNGDELFFRYKGKRIWPKKMKYFCMTSQFQKVDVEIPIIDSERWIEIELCDYNFLLPSSRLGVFRFAVDEVGGPFLTNLNAELDTRARYAINWKVVCPS
jgi:hypothetical protein